MPGQVKADHDFAPVIAQLIARGSDPATIKCTVNDGYARVDVTQGEMTAGLTYGGAVDIETIAAVLTRASGVAA